LNKRVLVVSQRVPYPPNKGEKIRTYHQIQCLINEGYQVDVCCSISDDEERKHLSDLNEKINGSTFGLSYKTPRWLRLFKGLLSSKSLSEANFHNMALQHWLTNYASANDYLAALFTASSLFTYASALEKESNRKGSQHTPRILIDFMDVDSDKWQQYAAQSNWPMTLLYRREARLVRRLEKACVHIADKVFLIAQAEIALFSKTVVNSPNVVELGNGIDAHEFKPAASNFSTRPSNYNLLFTGVMDYKPNIDAVLWFTKEIWPKVVDKFPTATFTIAGMNPTDAVKKLSEQQGIEVTGFVDDIMPYFQNASAFVAPFQIARGVQNKVLQAMSCGLPVVTTTMGAEGIMCKHETNVLIADKPEAFSHALINVLNSATTANLLAQNARQTILDHYSWESKMEPFFKTLKQ
jgi:sugar transferase (PEP-CTERM/EpsH1 system associated)